MSEDPNPPAPGDHTEFQPEDAKTESKELSVPKEASQHAEAPQIAGYVLVALIGRGAYAQVWKAWQVRTHKWVAVKIFIQKTGINWLFLQREVERLIRLDKHPHIVSLLDVDLTGEPPWYAMDYLEGGSLERFLDPKNPAPVEKAVIWMEELCQALAYVHSKGLIHCDLKPANILIDEEGRIRLADFGQSRIVTDSSSTLGTLFYMAPEQAVIAKDGEPTQPDIRWDIYGLGATMYAVLTGTVPHGDEENRRKLEAAKGLEERLAVYRDIIKRRPLVVALETQQRTMGQDLAAIIAKCTLTRVEGRYQALVELSADLHARRNGDPISLLASNKTYRLSKKVRKHLWIPAAALAATLLAIGVASEMLSWRMLAAQRSQEVVATRNLLAKAVSQDLIGLLKVHGLPTSGREAASKSVLAHRQELAARLHELAPKGIRIGLVDSSGRVAAGNREDMESWKYSEDILGSPVSPGLLDDRSSASCSEAGMEGWSLCIEQRLGTMRPNFAIRSLMGLLYGLYPLMFTHGPAVLTVFVAIFAIPVWLLAVAMLPNPDLSLATQSLHPDEIETMYRGDPALSFYVSGLRIRTFLNRNWLSTLPLTLIEAAILVCIMWSRPHESTTNDPALRLPLLAAALLYLLYVPACLGFAAISREMLDGGSWSLAAMLRHGVSMTRRSAWILVVWATAVAAVGLATSGNMAALLVLGVTAATATFLAHHATISALEPGMSSLQASKRLVDFIRAEGRGLSKSLYPMLFLMMLHAFDVGRLVFLKFTGCVPVEFLNCYSAEMPIWFVGAVMSFYALIIARGDAHVLLNAAMTIGPRYRKWSSGQAAPV